MNVFVLVMRRGKVTKVVRKLIEVVDFGEGVGGSNPLYVSRGLVCCVASCSPLSLRVGCMRQVEEEGEKRKERGREGATADSPRRLSCFFLLPEFRAPYD